MRADISAERLRELLHYEPATGAFVWRIDINKKRGSRGRAGAVAGCSDSHNYHLIGIDRQVYVAHRLAWLWMTGDWPVGDLDHINMNKKDNRWENLRLATRSGNMANTGPRADNTSGFKGVTRDESRRKWRAQIRVDGRNKFLGRFPTPEAAHDAYLAAAQDAFGEFARGDAG